MIINKTTKQIISNEEIVCKSFLSYAHGLMFRKKQNLIMIFPKERTISLHNFFVFYPIDVLVLDEDFKVIDLKKDFKPFTLWKSKKKAKYVVELAKEHSVVNVNHNLRIV